MTLDGACVLDDEDADEPQLIRGQPIVWLATGNHPNGISPYAPNVVFEKAE